VAPLRSASGDAARLRLALGAKLDELPGPAATLSLAALETGPPAAEQPPLGQSELERRQRLGEAVRQVRAVAGKDAVLRVLDVDVESRVPERRSLLTPFQEPE
jgi:protein ImuB